MMQNDAPFLAASAPYGAADGRQPAGRSVFLPLCLVALALTGWLAFQTAQLIVERQQIAAAEATLGPQEQNATRLRASLDAVATSTAKLASDGNSNAKTIVDELRKRGITINPTADAKPP